MRTYQYIGETGILITQIINEPSDFRNAGTTTNDVNTAATEEGRHKQLEAMHDRFKHFRLCTDGIWRDPKQCVERKSKRRKV